MCMGKLPIMAFALVLALAFGCALPGPPQFGKYGSEHSHADFKVYINNAAIDFSQPQYQEHSGHSGNNGEEISCGNESQLAHLDNGDGAVVHKHATGVTWGYFFSKLSMNMTDGCLKLQDGPSYCNDGPARWRFFVNGKETGPLKDTEIHDLDRVLFTYNATDAEIQRQLASVTSKSINQSKGDVCDVVEKNSTASG